jgi:hypothetical protein
MKINQNENHLRNKTTHRSKKQTIIKKFQNDEINENRTKSRSDRKQTETKRQTMNNLSNGWNQYTSMKIRIEHGTKRKEQPKIERSKNKKVS